MRKTGHQLPRAAAALCALLLLLLLPHIPAEADILYLPGSMKRIEDEAFWRNKRLDEVVPGDAVKYIGHKAFARSTVHYMYLPASVEKIEDDAFDYCENLVCLVPRGSYARKWCIRHDIPWEYSDYVASIEPDSPVVVVKNGTKEKILVNVEPAAAEELLTWTSSNEKILTVDRHGTVFGKYPGKATLTVTSPNGKVKAKIKVTVQANYRAALFSESSFAGGVIQRNRGDVRLMQEMLSSVTGPDGGKYEVYTFDDLVARDVYAKISELLIAPSRDGDVSMFFFASHGDYRSTSEQLAGRLWCKYKQTWLELPTLAKELGRVRGKVIVLLESCGPGAALHVFNSAPPADAEDPAEGIIRVFADADPGLEVYRAEEEDGAEKDEEDRPAESGEAKGAYGAGRSFMTEKFVVMTAAAYRQISYSNGSDACNLFPYWLVRGVGSMGRMTADTECGDSDGELALKELYSYVYNHTRHKQTPQVYPQNSDYVLFLRDE